MRRLFKNLLARVAAVALAAGLFAALPLSPVLSPVFSQAQAQAQELPRFRAYMEPINRTLDHLRDGDLGGMDDFLAGLGFGSAGRVGVVIKKWLNKDKVEDISKLDEENLGETVRRLTYAIRDSSDTYMFVRFYVIQAGEGWVLYNFNFNTDLTEFFPEWKDPN